MNYDNFGKLNEELIKEPKLQKYKEPKLQNYKQRIEIHTILGISQDKFFNSAPSREIDKGKTSWFSNTAEVNNKNVLT